MKKPISKRKTELFTNSILEMIDLQVNVKQDRRRLLQTKTVSIYYKEK